MPSEQATAAAEEIQSRHVGWPEDAPQYIEVVEKIAAIIDAAFGPVVSLLRECRREMRLYKVLPFHADAIDALIGKEES